MSELVLSMTGTKLILYRWGRTLGLYRSITSRMFCSICDGQEWFPFFVKRYLDKEGRQVKQFKNNCPGEEWLWEGTDIARYTLHSAAFLLLLCSSGYQSLGWQAVWGEVYEKIKDVEITVINFSRCWSHWCDWIWQNNYYSEVDAKCGS